MLLHRKTNIPFPICRMHLAFFLPAVTVLDLILQENRDPDMNVLEKVKNTVPTNVQV